MGVAATSFTVCRVGRLSGPAKIAVAFGHNTRSAPVPNADPSAENVALVAYNNPASPWAAPTPWDAVQKRIRAAEDERRAAGEPVRKQAKNAVHALEVFLSASPTYFRPGRRWAYGEYERDRLDAWREATMQWLERTYGDRLIDARLHLDEATPHIQAVVVPLTDDGRLSARDVFNGRKAHRDLQTSYAAAVAHLGIERGIEGSQAQHQRVKNVYGSMGEPDPEPPSIAVPVPPVFNREDWAAKQSARIRDEIATAFEAAALPGKLAKEATRGRDDARELAAEQRRQKQRAAEEQARELGKERMKTQVAEDASDARLNATDMARAAAGKAREALEAERKHHIDRMRDVPLEAVLEAAGWDKDPADLRQWRGPDQGRVSLKDDGAKWFDHDAGKGGGKAIDLAKHLTGQEFEGALGWLGRHFGDEQARAALRAKAEDPEPLPPPKPFQPPAHDPRKVPEVRAYLVEDRGLPERLIDVLLAKGKLLAESYRGHVNAVFVMRDRAGNPVGAERRGIGGLLAFSGLAAGSNRNEGRFQAIKGTSGAPITTVVATEAAIDALSTHALIRVPEGERWTFVSTAGARPDAPWLRAMIERGRRLLVGFDADETGSTMAAAMLRAYPTQAARLVPPAGKDWNDTLRARDRNPEAAERIDEAIGQQLDRIEAEQAQEGTNLGSLFPQ